MVGCEMYKMSAAMLNQNKPIENAAKEKPTEQSASVNEKCSPVNDEVFFKILFNEQGERKFKIYIFKYIYY